LRQGLLDIVEWLFPDPLWLLFFDICLRIQFQDI